MAELNGKTLALAAAGAGALLAARAIFKSRNDFSFDGKTVLITGGSRGLGLVMAREFASRGANVAICSRSPEEIESALADLRRFGRDVLGFPCDVTQKAQVNELIRIVEDRFGAVDVLVNNAGIIQVGPFEVMTIQDFESAMNTHFWGPLYTTLAILPGMRKRGVGRIVNISSIGGKIAVPHLLPYSASKFALAGLSEGLRAELAKDGIAVTTVCPGLMRTGSPRNATFKGKHRSEYAWFAISDSLPVTSINAERAARQIVDACRRGSAELIITIQAELAVRFHGLFPGITSDILGLVNMVLPSAGGIGRKQAQGKDSESALAPSILTKLSEMAARRNNEFRTA